MNTSSKEDITKMAFAGANNKLGQFNYSNSNKNEYDAATPSYLRIRENESKFVYFVFNFFSLPDLEREIGGAFRDFKHLEQDWRLDDCNSEKDESKGTNW